MTQDFDQLKKTIGLLEYENDISVKMLDIADIQDAYDEAEKGLPENNYDYWMRFKIVTPIVVVIGYLIHSWLLLFSLPVYLVMAAAWGYALRSGVVGTERSKRYREKKQAEYDAILAAGRPKDEEFLKLADERDILHKMIEEDTFVPKIYRELEVCYDLYDIFENRRVDTLKEAISVWEEERRHQEKIHVEQEKVEQLRLNDHYEQLRHEAELKAIKKQTEAIKDVADEVEKARYEHY